MAHHDHDVDANDSRNAPSDQPQVAALGDLGDYEVAEGYPDVRGWTVKLADGRNAGKVHELIVDTGAMRTRYLDVRLDRDLAGAAGERDVLVPIGTARLDGRGDNVLVDNVSAEQLAAMPAYEHGALTRDHENAVRRHFGATAGEGAATAATGTGATAGGNDFYDHEHFDDRRFFDTARDRDQQTGAAGSGRSGDAEVRVPLTREDVVAQSGSARADDAVIRRRAAQNAGSSDASSMGGTTGAMGSGAMGSGATGMGSSSTGSTGTASTGGSGLGNDAGGERRS